MNLIDTWLPWLASGLSIIGVFLNARKLIVCWPVWMAANVFWLFISVGNDDLPQTILWTVFFLSNCYGWAQWREAGRKNARVERDNAGVPARFLSPPCLTLTAHESKVLWSLGRVFVPRPNGLDSDTEVRTEAHAEPLSEEELRERGRRHAACMNSRSENPFALRGTKYSPMASPPHLCANCGDDFRDHCHVEHGVLCWNPVGLPRRPEG